MKKIENDLTPDLRRYATSILAAPSRKKVTIYIYDDLQEAIKMKGIKLKTWKYKVIVKARNENGRFAKGWALICCK